MKNFKLLAGALLLVGSLGMSTTPVLAQSVVFKIELAPGSNYCHLKFPSIREDTLDWDHPVLEPPGSPLIDYYGPCDHDPLGKEEIETQWIEHWVVVEDDDA
ncbi:MAG: hypothetical protein ACE5HC_14370 [Candidatus Binatia bacterium]